ncbi:MAG: hypothetical protein IJL17_00725, partial [Kiritimatiellae bacterium]|nr:hypothetical protein [Kiritimatiellia bacterium]
VGNYTDYFGGSQGQNAKNSEKSFRGGSPPWTPAPVMPTRNRRLAIATNQGFVISVRQGSKTPGGESILPPPVIAEKKTTNGFVRRYAAHGFLPRTPLGVSKSVCSFYIRERIPLMIV